VYLLYFWGLGFILKRKLQKLSRELSHWNFEAYECDLLWWSCGDNWFKMGLHGKIFNF
jgi:hypothetical protein